MTRALNHRVRCRTTLTEPRPSGSGLPNRAGYIASLVCLLGLSTWFHTTTANAQPQAEPTKDLADRLIRGESANEDIMVRIIKQMNHVEQRLSAAFDPGAETQRLQRRIVDRLDEAIAASIRQGSRSGASAGAMGDKRRRTPPSSGDPQGSDSPFSDDPQGSAPAKGDPQQTDRSGPLRDSKRGWGHLPPRDRDEVLQGINEKSLERFRQWIERYYQALAEKDDQ